jgi:hypothetical protein
MLIKACSEISLSFSVSKNAFFVEEMDLILRTAEQKYAWFNSRPKLT